MKREILVNSNEDLSAVNFEHKNFYEYILESFLKIQNIRTDDIYVENASEDATVKKVAVLKAFVDLYFSENSKNTTNSIKMNNTPFLDIPFDDIPSRNDRYSMEKKPFAEYIIEKELELATADLNAKYRSHTIFLQGNAGAGKSTLTQFIALWNWALWLKSHARKSPLNDSVKSFLLENEYKKYLEKFEKSSSAPFAFRLKLPDYGKFLFYLQDKDSLISAKTVIHFISFTIWTHVKRLTTDNSTYELWGNEIQSDHTLANNIYSFCADLINANSQIIYLFDGLDEAKFARDDLIVNIKDFITNFVKNENSRNLAIVTSRLENARDLLEEKVDIGNTNHESSTAKALFDEKCYLTSLNEQKVEQCVRNFCNAKYDTEIAQSTHAAIIDSYKNKPNTHQLMKTPLEVTMVCLVYQGNREIPENDAKLYKSYIDMYYNREKERLKLNNSKYKEFYDHPCTKDTIYHLLEWIGYQLELEKLNAISWEQVIQEAKQFNTNEDGVLRYRSLDTDYFNKIAEVTLTKLNLLNSTMDNLYEMDEVHKTVKEFLAALYIISPENESDFEKNIIKIVLLEKNVVFDFIMWILASSPSREKSFRNSVSLNFKNNDSQNIASICEAINIGNKISSKLLNSRIYRDRTPERAVVEKLATYVDFDIENELATSNVAVLLKEDDYNTASIILDHINGFIDRYNFMTSNLFKVLVKIIEEKLYVDPKLYPNIDRFLKSEDLGKNIIRNAKKYRTEVSEQAIAAILQDGTAINLSENNEEFLCKDLNQIKYIEAVKYLLSTDMGRIKGIDNFLYKEFGSYSLSSKEKTVYCYPSEDEVLSFQHLEYNFKNIWDSKSTKGTYKTFTNNVKNYGLSACAELLTCIGFLTYNNMFNYAKNLLSESYRKELTQMFGNGCINLLKESFPAIVLTARSFKKEYSDNIEEIIKSAFPNKSKKKFNDKLLKFEDALDLYKTKFPCSIIGHNIKKIDPWLQTLDCIKKNLINQDDSAGFDLFAFVFSIYEWSCQHGTSKIDYDDIHDALKPYKKELLELLFKQHESITGRDHIYLLHYILSAAPSEYIEQLNSLSTKQLYEVFPKYLNEQINLNANRNESFLTSESYRAMLHFLNALTLSANQYWEFYLKSFLLIRNAKEFIASFSFTSKPNENEDSYKLFCIIDLIKRWCKNSMREGIGKATSIEIIKYINEIKNEEKPLVLHLVVNYLINNFKEEPEINLTSLLIELLKQIQNVEDFYSPKIKLYSFLEKHLKAQV